MDKAPPSKELCSFASSQSCWLYGTDEHFISRCGSQTQGMAEFPALVRLRSPCSKRAAAFLRVALYGAVPCIERPGRRREIP